MKEDIIKKLMNVISPILPDNTKSIKIKQREWDDYNDSKIKGDEIIIEIKTMKP